MNEDAEVAVLFSITMAVLITYFISGHVMDSKKGLDKQDKNICEIEYPESYFTPREDEK